MKKRVIISFIITLCLLVSITATAFAADFIDINDHWANVQINKWADKGLAGGYSDGTFKPNDPITRAEFVALTNRAFNISSEKAVVNFKDVNTNNWFYNEVAAASEEGYIGGYPDNTFKPNNSITRQEAASILTRLLGLDATTAGLNQFKDAALIPQWSKGSVGAVVANSLMSGYPDDTYKAKRNITRAEAVVTLDRALNFNTPQKSSGLKGKVTRNGSGYANAVVKVFKADGYEVLDEVKTDTNGNFKFSLNTGSYDLTATTTDKVAYLSDVRVTTDGASVKLALEDAAILTGSLVGEKNGDVEEATMLFTTNPTFVTETDKDADFKVVILPNRTYTVRVYEPGEEDEEPVIVKEELEVTGAGEHNVEELEAPFTVGSSGGGGGGGSPTGGGGGTGGGEESDTLTLTSDYDGNNDTLSKNVIIDADGITLSNVTIEGDLTIKPVVDEFTAVNITVNGKTFVNGGSPHTIKFKDSTIGEVTINEQDVRLEASGTTSIKKAIVKTSGVTFDSETGSDFTIDEVSLESGGKTTFKNVKKVKKLSVKADNTEIAVEGDGTIEEVVVETSGKVKVDKNKITKIVIKDSNAKLEDTEGNILNPPKLKDEIGELSLLLNDSNNIALSNHFEDADDDIAEYNATPSSDNIALSLNKTSGMLSITASRVGEGAITVLVTDDDGLCYEYSFNVTVRKDIEIPENHTLPKLLDAMETTLLQLTTEEWDNLKFYDQYLTDTNAEALRDSLEKAELLDPLKWVVGSNIRMDEAKAIIDILNKISNEIPNKDISDRHDKIKSKVSELKTTYATQIDKIKSKEALKDVSQEDLYNYFVELYNYIINNNIDTSNLDNYEEDLYDAALVVLKNGSHSELKGAAETAFTKAQNYFIKNESDALTPIFKNITFDDNVDGNLVKLIKDVIVSDTSYNGNEDVKEMLTIFDELLNLSKTFLEN